MSVSLTYEFKGLNRVENSLRRLASEYRQETDDVVRDWTKAKRAGLKSYNYPPQSNAPQPFKTARQRKWFFWALANGIISVPYKRTGRLANSWRARKHGWSDWVIENSAAYAALVVGKSMQARYHQGTWWIADEIIARDVPQLTKDLSDRLIGLAK